MTSVRQRVRSEKWIPIKITWADRRKHDVTHIDLVKWAGECSTGKVESTLIKEPNMNPASVFVFENKADASMFALRWK